MDKVTAILDQNAFTDATVLPEATQKLVQHRQSTLGPLGMLFYQQPLNIVRGQGVWLFDAEGKQYLDAYNNVPSLGHSHPAITEAVSQQISTLNIHTRYLEQQTHQYAESLINTLNLNNKRVAFTCSGSEANDLAIRLAQLQTGHKGIIVTRAAYHGNTELSMSVSPSAFRQDGLPDWVVTVDVPFEQHDSDAAALSVAQSTQQAISTLQQRGYGCAAFVIDTICSSDGVFTSPNNWLTNAVSHIKQVGGLLIADEVQPGFGRTGEFFWGYQRLGLTPDLVTMGKPMGNGYPIAAVIADNEVFAEFQQRCGYFNTFGGSNAAIAAASTVLKVIKQEALQENALATGDYLKAGLQQLADHYACIAQIRGVGLYYGVDINEDSEISASFIVNALRQQSVLIGSTGIRGQSLKIRPPLCFSKQHADQLINTLAVVLGNAGN